MLQNFRSRRPDTAATPRPRLPPRHIPPPLGRVDRADNSAALTAQDCHPRDAKPQHHHRESSSHRFLRPPPGRTIAIPGLLPRRPPNLDAKRRPKGGSDGDVTVVRRRHPLRVNGAEVFTRRIQTFLEKNGVPDSAPP